MAAMTEAEWLACENPRTMLEFLRATASDRKLRLFAAAAFRRLAASLPDPRQRRGIETLGELAEGTITRAGCGGWRRRSDGLSRRMIGSPDPPPTTRITSP